VLDSEGRESMTLYRLKKAPIKTWFGKMINESEEHDPFLLRREKSHKKKTGPGGRRKKDGPFG